MCTQPNALYGFNEIGLNNSALRGWQRYKIRRCKRFGQRMKWVSLGISFQDLGFVVHWISSCHICKSRVSVYQRWMEKLTTDCWDKTLEIWNKKLRWSWGSRLAPWILRNMYRNVKLDTPKLLQKLSLYLAVKAVNGSEGPSCPNSKLLIFAVTLKIPVIPKGLPIQIKRMQTMTKKKIQKTVSKQVMRTAKGKSISRAAENDIQISKEVLMYG